MDSGKRIWLKEENRSPVTPSKVLKQIDKLKGEVMAMKGGEERWEEKFKHLESKKRKLKMDLKAAEDEKKALRKTLQVKDATIMMLRRQTMHARNRAFSESQKVAELRRRIHVLEKSLFHMRKEPVSNDKTELMQRIKELQKENVALKAEKMKRKMGNNKWNVCEVRRKCGLPQKNIYILGNPPQNQGKKSAKRTRPNLKYY